MTILAFGCSVTHGTEIAAMGNSKDNIPYSYPALVAEYLGVDCINQAFCGNSNENIFHEAMDSITSQDNITAAIVGWTSVEREVWQCDGRTWQFIPSWCATTSNPWKPFRFHTPGSETIPQRCADKQEYLPALDSIYDLLIKYKFDIAVYSKKLKNYITALRAHCQVNNVRLIETCWANNMDGIVNIGKIGKWYPAMQRHPDAEEQKLFAKQIIDYYKL
jgi:hypothetical protein